MLISLKDSCLGTADGLDLSKIMTLQCAPIHDGLDIAKVWGFMIWKYASWFETSDFAFVGSTYGTAI